MRKRSHQARSQVQSAVEVEPKSADGCHRKYWMEKLVLPLRLRSNIGTTCISVLAPESPGMEVIINEYKRAKRASQLCAMLVRSQFFGEVNLAQSDYL